MEKRYKVFRWLFLFFFVIFLTLYFSGVTGYYEYQNYQKIYDANNSKEEWFDNMKNLAQELEFCVNMKEYKENPDGFIGSIADFSDIIRIAITNRHNTPDIYSIMQILGKENVINRINLAKNTIK